MHFLKQPAVYIHGAFVPAAAFAYYKEVKAVVMMGTDFEKKNKSIHNSSTIINNLQIQRMVTHCQSAFRVTQRHFLYKPSNETFRT